MKKAYLYLLIIIVIFLLVLITLKFFTNDNICTKEAKICLDGTSVGRNSELNCEFNSCPELQFCDADNLCDEGIECYKFEDNEKPYCYLGDPCEKCPPSTGGCAIGESYPSQVKCNMYTT